MTPISRCFHRCAPALCTVALTTPAAAELPAPIKELVQAAIATGDAAQVRTVITLAKRTNPDDASELDAMQAEFDAGQKRQAETAAAEKERAIRSAGPFDNWQGKVAIGASRSTGNTENVGLSVGLDVQRKGIDWQHRLRATADFQRSGGVTTWEKYFVSYEPRYNLSSRAFLFDIAQFESNRFQGFDARYAVSGGVGYRVLDGKRMQLAIKAGPAWRRTDYTDGTGNSSLAALAGLDFDWAITDRLKFTQDANMLANAGSSAVIIVASDNTSISLVSGLEAKVSDQLTTRFSYSVDYDTNPPLGAVKADTITRMSLVYGF